MVLQKILLLGDHNVGKTTLREKFMGNGYNSKYFQMKDSFTIKKAQIGDKEIKFQVWEMPENDKFDSTRALRYAGSQGAILIFDVTQKESLDHATTNWLNDLKKFITNGPIPLVLLGNKIDLRVNGEATEGNQNNGKETAKSISNKYFGNPNDVMYVETSAMTGENIDEVFTELGKKIIDQANLNF